MKDFWVTFFFSIEDWCTGTSLKMAQRNWSYKKIHVWYSDECRCNKLSTSHYFIISKKKDFLSLLRKILIFFLSFFSSGKVIISISFVKDHFVLCQTLSVGSFHYWRIFRLKNVPSPFYLEIDLERPYCLKTPLGFGTHSMQFEYN